MKLLSSLFIITLVLTLSACTGAMHKLPEVSDAEVKQVYKESLTHKTVFINQGRSGKKNSVLVKNISTRLLKHIRPLCDHTGYESCFFQVVYKGKDTINAIASENNKITIYRGLIDLLKSEDEIAAVIAHEMAHHLSSHNKKTTQNAMAGSFVAGMLAAAVKANDPYYNPATDPAVQNSMNLGAAVGALSYSREEEREADLLGAYLISRAGYDLKKAERVLWLLYTMGKSHGNNDNRSSFGDSHPAGPERIASWRKAIKEIRSNKSKLPYKAEKNTGK